MKKSSNFVPLVIIAAMFSVLGFAVGINAFFVPFVKAAFNINTAASYLVVTANFSAFVLFGYPSLRMLKSLGYKKSIVFSFLILAAGMLLIVPAAKLNSFPVFLLALFVNGMGQTLLNSAVNPYVTILGPENSAASRISLMGMCNKFSLGLAPVILSIFIDIARVQLNDAIIPFYLISFILVLAGILVSFAPLPELKATGENDDQVIDNSRYSESRNSILQFPHLLLGIVAIFFYGGVEMIAITSIYDFAIENSMKSPERFVTYTSYGYILGYLAGVLLIPKIITQVKGMVICSILGLLLSIAILFIPGQVSVYLVAALGLANSLIWPAIWPLALSDLGKFTKQGSSLLVMAIAGYGIVPPVLGMFRDHFSTYQYAYVLLLPMYIFFIWYAKSGSRIRTYKKVAIK